MAKRILNGHVVRDDAIVTADDIAPSLDAQTHREWIKRMRIKSRLCKVIMDAKQIDFTPQGDPLKAEVLFGAWKVRCDSDGCRGVENVTPNDPITFCFSCCNTDNGFHVRPVEFPSEYGEIEAALLARKPQDRHWLEHETVLDLVLQNNTLQEAGKLRV